MSDTDALQLKRLQAGELTIDPVTGKVYEGVYHLEEDELVKNVFVREKP